MTSKWNEERTAELKKWLEADKPIIDPGQAIAVYTQDRINILIMAYNEWETKNNASAARRFKCIHWWEKEAGNKDFLTACKELGYTVIDDCLRLKEAGPGLTPRLGIYGKDGKNHAQNVENYYRFYKEDVL